MRTVARRLLRERKRTKLIYARAWRRIGRRKSWDLHCVDGVFNSIEPHKPGGPGHRAYRGWGRGHPRWTGWRSGRILIGWLLGRQGKVAEEGLAWAQAPAPALLRRNNQQRRSRSRHELFKHETHISSIVQRLCFSVAKAPEARAADKPAGRLPEAGAQNYFGSGASHKLQDEIFQALLGGKAGWIENNREGRHRKPEKTNRHYTTPRAMMCWL